MGESQLFSSFMMLNEHLYHVFVEYILSGRNRAPPETELMEMLPTFQFGARTDRKAIQSKFKSWAKRMDFENGCLTLSNTGKIIVPREKCDDLVMYMHSSAHQDIENVIAQIQKTYSWTKKNFGMDRDVVIDSIMRNCKRNECLKKLRMEIARLSNSLCSGQQNSQVPEVMVYGMPPPMSCLPPYHFPIAFPFPPLFPPFEIPLFKGMCDMGNPMAMCNEAKNVSMTLRTNTPGSENVSEVENKTKEKHPVLKDSTSTNNSDAVNKASYIRFKKPKNLCEYKILIDAVKQKPEEYPTVLGDKKTQFLVNVGIAPKSVCSSLVLKRFRKEFRNKMLLNRNCVVYRDRKVLRDRNKLKKISGQRKRHIYLGMKKSNNSVSVFSDSISHALIAEKQSCFHKSARKVKSEGNKASSTGNKSDDDQRKKPVEVIIISSSDEESPQESTFLAQKNIQKNEAIVSLAPKESEIADNMPTETTVQQVSDSKTDTKCSEVKNKQASDCSGNKATEANQEKLISLPDAPYQVASTDKILLPKNIGSPVLSGVSSHSNEYSGKNSFSDSSVPISNSIHKIIMPNYSVQLLQTNSNPVAIQRMASVQTETCSAPYNQSNIVPQIVHPALLSKIPAAPTFFVVGKEPKGMFCINPQLSKTGNPQKFGKILPKVTDDSKVTPMFILSAASQLYQTKLNNPEKESAFYDKLFRRENKSKTDINEEMSRITNWIHRMKSHINPCMFTQEVEKSTQKLLSQLDLGLYLVKEAKRSLAEIENMDTQ